MKLSYEELVKQVIVDGLEVLKGNKEYGDSQDFGSEICYAMNSDNTYIEHIYRYFDNYEDTMSFVFKNWEKSAEFNEYWIQCGSDAINAFDEAEKFTYLMLTHEVEELIAATDFIEENRDEYFILTNEVIETLKKELGLEDVQVSEWTKDYVDEDEVELER